MRDENESEEAVAELRRAAVEINQRYEGGENTERFIQFATTALGSLVRVRPKRTLALDRVGEHRPARGLTLEGTPSWRPSCWFTVRATPAGTGI